MIIKLKKSDFSWEILPLLDRISKCNDLIIETHLFLIQIANDKGLNIGKTPLSIMPPMGENNKLHHATVEFKNKNGVYKIRYNGIPHMPQLMCVRLFKDNKLYNKDNHGFQSQKILILNKIELSHLIIKLDDELITSKKIKSKHLNSETSTVFRDPHGKEEIDDVPIKTFTNLHSNLFTNDTPLIKKIGSKTSSKFNLADWWKSIQSQN